MTANNREEQVEFLFQIVLNVLHDLNHIRDQAPNLIPPDSIPILEGARNFEEVLFGKGVDICKREIPLNSPTGNQQDVAKE